MLGSPRLMRFIEISEGAIYAAPPQPFLFDGIQTT